VTLAATAVFSYAGLVPASLYGFLWWSSSGVGTATLSFLELVCLYGYSLAIYIPVSLLWLVQVSWWQWLCVLAGAGMSGYVLFLPIWPAVRDQAAKSAVIVMVVVLALHLLLACGFMLYFFHVPAVAAGAGGHNTTQAVVTPVVSQDDHAVDEDKEKEAEAAAVVENNDSKNEAKRSNKPASVSESNDIGEEKIEKKEEIINTDSVSNVEKMDEEKKDNVEMIDTSGDVNNDKDGDTA